MAASILIWWLISQALGLVGLPLAGLIFRSLPDGGYPFAKTLGLLLTGYLAWLLAMLGLGRFSAPLLVVSALAVGGGGLWVWRAAPAPRRALLPPWPTILGYEAIFLAAMLACVWMRAHDPTPWGTERPMDFAFFNAIQRSASFPPSDPWLAGYSINYYYFGYLLMAGAAQLSGLAPSTAYNLALALIFALTALGVAGVVMNLIGLAEGRQGAGRRTQDAGVRPRRGAAATLGNQTHPPAHPPTAAAPIGTAGCRRQDAGGRMQGTQGEGEEPERGIESSDLLPPATRHLHPATRHLPPATRLLPPATRLLPPAARLLPPAFAVLGVLLVLVAGNQSGAIQVLLGDERAVVLDGPQLVAAAGQALGGASRVVLPYAASTDDFGDLSDWDRRDMAAPGAFNWWWPSRSLWDTYTIRGQVPPVKELRYDITEFPFFSFRLGDMHPHVMSLPFTLLALALALATLARAEPPDLGRGRAGWAELIASGVVLGSLYTINSWDLPTYLLLYAGAALVLQRRLADAGPINWLAYARHLGLVVLASFLLFLPFHLTFRSLVGGAEPLIDLPLIGKLTSIIAPYPASRSGLHAFLIIFGLFALPLTAFVYLVRPPSCLPPPASRHSPPASRLLPPASYLAPPALLLLGLLIGFPLLALLGLGALAVGMALRLSERPAESFGLLVVALGCAIIFGTEVIYIRDTFEGWSTRFNTIFKFYYQVWLLWGALTPFGLWYILARTSGGRRVAGGAIAAAFVLLLAGAGVYPALALRDMGMGEMRDLDAPTPREQTEGGRASITWLRDNAAPGSVILEAAEIINASDVATGAQAPACGGSYNVDGYAGISAATGLPTVLGWTGHEGQWRGGDPSVAAEIQPRCTTIHRIYSTTDTSEARQLLASYGVRYVYVGGLERATYPAEGLAKFDQIGTPTSFGDGEVIIYTLSAAHKP